MLKDFESSSVKINLPVLLLKWRTFKMNMYDKIEKIVISPLREEHRQSFKIKFGEECIIITENEKGRVEGALFSEVLPISNLINLLIQKLLDDSINLKNTLKKTPFSLSKINSRIDRVKQEASEEIAALHDIRRDLLTISFSEIADSPAMKNLHGKLFTRHWFSAIEQLQKEVSAHFTKYL